MRAHPTAGGDAVRRLVADLKGGLAPRPDLLAALPVEGLRQEVFAAMLARFVNLAAEARNFEAVRAVIARWERANGDGWGDEPGDAGGGVTDLQLNAAGEGAFATDVGLVDGYNLPVRALLFTLPQVRDDVLRFVADAYPDRSFASYVAAFIKYDSTPELEVATRRLEAAFPPEAQTLAVWRSLRELLADLEEGMPGGNPVMRGVIAAAVAARAEAGEKPEWVRDFGLGAPGAAAARPEAELPFDFELVPPEVPPPLFDLPPEAEALALLTEFVPDEGARADLAARYRAADAPGKFAILQAELAQREGAEEGERLALFRILGPVHPTVGARFDPTSDAPCDRFGGCRMFTCVEFENYGEEGIVDEDSGGEITALLDWYTGTCEQCLAKIPSRHWAVRRPLLYGGWRGCFCSWKCVTDAEPPCAGPVGAAMAGYMDAACRRFGIQDRRYL